MGRPSICIITRTSDISTAPYHPPPTLFHGSRVHQLILLNHHYHHLVPDVWSRRNEDSVPLPTSCGVSKRQSFKPSRLSPAHPHPALPTVLRSNPDTCIPILLLTGDLCVRIVGPRVPARDMVRVSIENPLHFPHFCFHASPFLFFDQSALST